MQSAEAPVGEAARGRLRVQSASPPQRGGASAPAMRPRVVGGGAHQSPSPRATTHKPAPSRLCREGRSQWGPVGNEGGDAMCPVWGAVPTTNVLDLLTYVKFESHNQIKFTKMNATIRRLAEEMGIGFEQGPSFSYTPPPQLNSVFLKKRQQLSLTLISGPHVHKKSRDQYKIDHYSGFFIWSPPSLAEGDAPALHASATHGTTAKGPSSPSGLPPASEVADREQSMRSATSRIGPNLAGAPLPRGAQAGKLLELRSKLYQLEFDTGFNISYTYKKKDALRINLVARQSAGAPAGCPLVPPKGV